MGSVGSGGESGVHERSQCLTTSKSVAGAPGHMTDRKTHFAPVTPAIESVAGQKGKQTSSKGCFLRGSRKESLRRKQQASYVRSSSHHSFRRQEISSPGSIRTVDETAKTVQLHETSTTRWAHGTDGLFCFACRQ